MQSISESVMTSVLNKTQLRGISSLFSRRVFTGVVNNNLSLLIQLITNYIPQAEWHKPLSNILKKSYSCLARNYRCEYVYKNELINQKLIKEFGTDSTIAFNEFKVGNSIADLAMFNGESKAFEIKSDLDSPFRLSGQMFDYTRLFQKCYIVVSEEALDNYINDIGHGIGIIVMSFVKRHLELIEFRKAEQNEYIDSDLVISCLHTNEYIHLIKEYYGYIPSVSMFDMFESCKKMMKFIPHDKLQHLFLKEIESRKTATQRLKKVQKELRQMCLSMNMSSRDIENLNLNLSTTLN